MAFKRRLPLPPAIVLLRSTGDFTGGLAHVLDGEQACTGGFFVIDARGLRWRPFGGGAMT